MEKYAVAMHHGQCRIQHLWPMLRSKESGYLGPSCFDFDCLQKIYNNMPNAMISCNNTASIVTNVRCGLGCGFTNWYSCSCAANMQRGWWWWSTPAPDCHSHNSPATVTNITSSANLSKVCWTFMEKQFNVTRRTNPDWKNKLFGRAWAALLFVSHLQSQNCGQTPDLVSARTQWSGKLADCVSVEEILDELGKKKVLDYIPSLHVQMFGAPLLWMSWFQ